MNNISGHSATISMFCNLNSFKEIFFVFMSISVVPHSIMKMLDNKTCLLQGLFQGKSNHITMNSYLFRCPSGAASRSWFFIICSNRKCWFVTMTVGYLQTSHLPLILHVNQPHQSTLFHHLLLQQGNCVVT